jgi:GrpB-like predicted nucleotidyltransferase (UPF0157 family)
MIEQPGDLGLGRGLAPLAEPNPRWPELFAGDAEALRPALEAFGAAVEHCGSTSVPGLAAKPILDILERVRAPIDVA